MNCCTFLSSLCSCVWSCVQCKTTYDLDEIEQSLIDAVHRKSMAFVLQDLKCLKCNGVCTASFCEDVAFHDCLHSEKVVLLPIQHHHRCVIADQRKQPRKTLQMRRRFRQHVEHRRLRAESSNIQEYRPVSRIRCFDQQETMWETCVPTAIEMHKERLEFIEQTDHLRNRNTLVKLKESVRLQPNQTLSFGISK